MQQRLPVLEPGVALGRLEQIRERFKDGRERGEHPDLKEHLADVQGAERRALLIELVREDLEYSSSSECTPLRYGYLERLGSMKYGWDRNGC